MELMSDGMWWLIPLLITVFCLINIIVGFWLLSKELNKDEK